MHAKASLKMLSLFSLSVFLTILSTGCVPRLLEKRVLAGSWTLSLGSNPNADLTNLALNFDSFGNLVSVTYTFNGATATKTLTTTSQTSVDGKDVKISSSGLILTLSFTGTLNNADTVITGNASWTLNIGNTSITSQPGPATLTKQGVTPTKAVLAGSWVLAQGTPPNPDLTNLTLNFDANGDLVSVTYTFTNATATKDLTTTSTTTVNGQNVTISSSGLVLTLLFAGTLDVTNTVITGNTSWTLSIGATDITAPLGPATLTKVST